MFIQRLARFAIVTGFLLLPAAAWAQGGTIAGVVKDTSGGAVPGVTVEAASPALIEKVRTVVTDGEGQYKLVGLAPGAYIVTFSLTGFGTVKREGIALTTGFTANVNAELKVGTLEETVTVSGAAPVVDTQQVLAQTTISRTTLDELPTTRRVAQLVTIMPGLGNGSTTNVDPGGIGSDQGNLAAHGQRLTDATYNFAGIDSKVAGGGGFPYNIHMFNELVVNTSAGSAEASSGGVQVNIVPKDGGNTFSGDLSTENTGPRFQNDNITPELIAQGLRVNSLASVRKFYDVGGGLGGPLIKDKLWFYGAYRKLFRSQYQQGNYYNLNQQVEAVPGNPRTVGLVYVPDLSKPAYTLDFSQDYTMRETWQMATKHKATFHFVQAPSCQCTIGLLGASPVAAPETVGLHDYKPQYMAIVTYTYIASNKLLFETGVSTNRYSRNPQRPPADGTGGVVTVNNIAVTDVGLNLQYGSRAIALSSGAGAYRPQPDQRYHQKFAVSYITGSHNYKVGLDLNESWIGREFESDVNQINQGMSYTFNNGKPQAVTIWATPYAAYNRATEHGIYGQDQWTKRRLTLDYGVRYHVYTAWVPAMHLPAGPWVPARDFPAVNDVPHWKNLSPRVGGAYDLFGTGKTALKASLGRYAARNDPNMAVSIPIKNQAESVARNWNDANGNFTPDCDLTNPNPNLECQGWNDLTFGQVRTPSTNYATDALTGFNLQQFNWQGSVSAQHQLREGMALNVGYFRTWYGNFQATDNLAVGPADYDQFCITAPTDSRLSNSGQQICGLYDLKPAVFGRVNNLVTQGSNFGGKQTEVFNGIDITLNAKFGKGGNITGGVSASHLETNNCFQNSDPSVLAAGALTSTPRTTAFCDVARPWKNGTDTKWAIVYPFPFGFLGSAIYQNIPGVPIASQLLVTNAQAKASLGRDLGSCRGAAVCNATVLVDLIPPGTQFGDRIQELDLRFARNFRFASRYRLRANFDMYNITNASTVLSINARYNTTNWPQPIQVMGGRLFKFGALFEF